MKYVAVLFSVLALCFSHLASSAITYHGVGATPIDGGTNNEGAPGTPVAVSITPPPSTCAGALLLLWTHSNASGRTPVVVNAAGQTWTQLTSNSNSTSGSLTWLWARFSGTWSGSPSVRNNTSDYGSLSAGVVAFCPTNSANTWEVDVAQNTAAYTSPASPYNVTIGSQTTTSASTVAVALWTSTNRSQWGQLTAGWNYPDSIAQWRNYDTDLSVSMAYKIQTAAGATGSVVNTQTSSGGGAGWTSFIAFREVSAPSGSITYQGVSASPADGGTNNEGAPGNPVPVVVTPPAGTCAGALLLMWAHSNAASRTPVVMNSGGQAWTTLSSNSSGTAGSLTWLWARFNGTWSASPSIRNNTADYGSLSAGMTVFCPTNASNTWDVDVAQSTSAYAAPGAPYSVTITGQTPTVASTVSVALWTSTNASQWGSLTDVGWTNPGASNQWRNTDTDLSVSLAYRIQNSVAPTGSVTRSQTSATGGSGWKSMVTFKEVGGGAPSGQAIKFHPGTYVFDDTYHPFNGTNEMANRLAFMDAHCNNPNIAGYQIASEWSGLEGNVAGDYAQGIANVQTLLNKAQSCNKHLLLGIVTLHFGGTGSDLSQYFPAYLWNTAGTGPRAAGTPNYDPNANGFGTNSQYGLTSLTGYGVERGITTRVWQAATNARIKALGAAYGAAFDTNPYFEGVVTGETALNVEGNLNGYSVDALQTQLYDLLASWRASMPTTQIRLAINDFWPDSRMSSLLDLAEQLDLSVGGPDIRMDDVTQGDRVYVGLDEYGNATLPNRRGVLPWMAEVQYPEMELWDATTLLGNALNGFTATNARYKNPVTGAYDGAHFVMPSVRPMYLIWTLQDYGPRVGARSTAVLSLINSTQGYLYYGAPASVPCPSTFSHGCNRN